MDTRSVFLFLDALESLQCYDGGYDEARKLAVKFVMPFIITGITHTSDINMTEELCGQMIKRIETLLS